ncbi:MAG: hypothetical protein L3J46_06185, partial [Kangiellaceae bacterium]|nr:hypothetical protein [Kangiellaceae bacterium]
MFKILIVSSCLILFSLSLLASDDDLDDVDELSKHEIIANKLAHKVSEFVEAKAKADYGKELKSVQGLL